MSMELDLPFVRSAKQRRVAEKPKQVDLKEENARLRVQLSAMQVERDFWSEQARALQNHLQTVMRGQADILAQMARSAVCPDDVHAAVAAMGAELRRPLTTVEATMALAAAARDGTQGRYTAVNASNALRPVEREK